MTREYQLEILQASDRGSAVVARALLDGKGSIKFPWSVPSGSLSLPRATLEGDRVVVAAAVQ